MALSSAKLFGHVNVMRCRIAFVWGQFFKHRHYEGNNLAAESD
jgi:hypothetical protein